MFIKIVRKFIDVLKDLSLNPVPWQTPERQTPERQPPERQTPERQTPDETNS